MSHAALPPTPPTLPAVQPSPLCPLGGALGIGGCLAATGIFLLGCAGFDAAFVLSIVPFLLGVAGLALTVAGAIAGAPREDMQVVAGLFVGLLSLLAGLLEMAVQYKWTLFYAASQAG